MVSIASSSASAAVLVRDSLICLLRLGMPKERIMQRMARVRSSSNRVNPWGFIVTFLCCDLKPKCCCVTRHGWPFIQFGMPYVVLEATSLSERDRLIYYKLVKQLRLLVARLVLLVVTGG